MNKTGLIVVAAACLTLLVYGQHTIRAVERRTNELQKKFDDITQRLTPQDTTIAGTPGKNPEYAKSFWVKTFGKGRRMQFVFSEEKAQDFPLVIVHFWASWCQPCVKEMSSLMDFADANPDIFTASVSIADDRLTAKTALKKFGGKWFDSRLMGVACEEDFDGPVAKYYNLDGVPVTLFINRGRIVFRLDHEVNWQNPEIARVIADFKVGRPIAYTPPPNQ